MSLRNWVVEISEDGDSRVFGPYSEATARSIMASFNKAVDREELRTGNAVRLFASAYALPNPNITTLRKEYDL